MTNGYRLFIFHLVFNRLRRPLKVQYVVKGAHSRPVHPFFVSCQRSLEFTEATNLMANKTACSVCNPNKTVWYSHSELLGIILLSANLMIITIIQWLTTSEPCSAVHGCNPHHTIRLILAPVKVSTYHSSHCYC